MPRQQERRLTTTKGAEVPLGTMTSTVEQRVTAPVEVIGKTKGQKLAEALQMTAQTGAKAYAQVQQIDEAEQKENASMAVAEDKIDIFNKLNEFDTEEEKARFLEDVIKKVSQPEEDKYYRHYMLGAVADKYSRHSYNAKVEGQGILNSQMVDTLINNLDAEGTMNYEEASKFYNERGALKKDFHKNVVSAIESHLMDKVSGINTKEEYDEFVKHSKKVMAEYNSYTYLGGSKAVEATDIKLKLNTKLDTVKSELLKVVTDNYNTTVANLTIEAGEGNTTTEKIEKVLDEGVKQGLIKESKAITKKNQLLTKLDKAKLEKTQVTEYDNRADNNTKLASKTLTEGAIKKIKASLVEDMKKDIASGDTESLVSLVTGNKNILLPVFKETMLATTDQDTALNRGNLYTQIKNTEYGNQLLTNISDKDKAFYDVLELMTDLGEIPNIPELYDNIQSPAPANWENEDREDFNKLTKKLPQKMRDGLYTYASTLLKAGKDIDDALELTEGMIERNKREIDTDGWFGVDTVELINFDATGLAQASEEEITAVLSRLTAGAEVDVPLKDITIVYDEKYGDLVVYDNKDMLIPLTIFSNEDAVNEYEEYLSIQAMEADIERHSEEEARQRAVKAFTYTMRRKMGGLSEEKKKKADKLNLPGLLHKPTKEEVKAFTHTMKGHPKTNQPRNVRNNNLGNIKHNPANKWDGQTKTKQDKTFVSFETPEMGVRALTKVVNANLRATTTIEEYVNRYASEPSEQAYYKETGELMSHLKNYALMLANSQGLTDIKAKHNKKVDMVEWIKATAKAEGSATALEYFTDDIIKTGIELAK